MNDTQRMKFGAHITRLRRQAGLSQAELASAASLKECTVRNVEKGAFNTPFDVLNRIAVVLGGELKIVINKKTVEV